MPNYNSKTGIPFGVIQGNNVQDLLDDIFTNGTNLSFEDFQEQIKKELSEAIAGVLAQYTRHPEAVAESLAYDDILETLMDGGLCDYYEC